MEKFVVFEIICMAFLFISFSILIYKSFDCEKRVWKRIDLMISIFISAGIDVLFYNMLNPQTF